MLTLPIKKKWYDMILDPAHPKREEYREIKPYYTARFKKALGEMGTTDEMWFENLDYDDYKHLEFYIVFRNGYAATSPAFCASVSLSMGEGREDWGAERGRECYRLKIDKVFRRYGEAKSDCSDEWYKGWVAFDEPYNEKCHIGGRMHIIAASGDVMCCDGRTFKTIPSQEPPHL